MKAYPSLNALFEKAGLQYNNPHTFRDMLTNLVINHYGMQELVALSMNLGHESPAITIANYYQPTPAQQFDILSKMGKVRDGEEMNSEIMEFIRRQMEKEKLDKK